MPSAQSCIVKCPDCACGAGQAGGRPHLGVSGPHGSCPRAVGEERHLAEEVAWIELALNSGLPLFPGDTHDGVTMDDDIQVPPFFSLQMTTRTRFVSTETNHFSRGG